MKSTDKADNMNVVRERKVGFGYIHGVNIDRNIRQIYNELIEQGDQERNLWEGLKKSGNT